MNQKTVYYCSKCDAQQPKWSGRCLECGAWGTMQETAAPQKKNTSKKVSTSIPAKVASFDSLEKSSLQHLISKSFPASRVFSKGLVMGSITLLAGEPGAGKSTLSLQLAQNYSAENGVLYVSAEESIAQIKDRGDRLGAFGKQFMIAESTNLEEIIATVETNSPKVVIIDSLQTIVSDESDAELGSINQIKIVTSKLSQLAKSRDIALITIGHVTKDGALAGPKSLEHLVDAVYYLESDKKSNYRLLRCFKNRYGEASQVLVTKLTNKGLVEVKDAATIFIQNYKAKPGSVLTITIIDNQPFFIEVQALVSKSSFGYAKRTASGFSKQRLEMLLAIIKKSLHLDFDAHDVYINVAGGFIVNEPAMDLAVVLSLLSSIKEKTVSEKTICFGEMGLSGELRVVKDTALRLKEIEKHKFTEAFVPPLDKQLKSKATIHSFESLGDVMKHLVW